MISAQFRPAGPDDAAFLAEIVLLASRSHLPRGVWDLVLDAADEDLRELVEFIVLQGPTSFCHYANFIIAEVGGRPAAASSAYDPGWPDLVAPGELISTAFVELGLDEAAFIRALERMAPYQRALPVPRKGLWTVEWVATLPAYRRRGITRTILDRILVDGRERGFSRAQVTTLVGNTPALDLYAKRGFQVAEEKRSPDFERVMGAPGLVRLELALTT